MMRSLFSGVAGLKTHQTRMDVIGNNIANVNTTAYKSQNMVFSDLLYQTTQAASGASATTGRGGINPRQIGLGSKTGAISTAITTQGSAQSTNNPWDIMIEGDAFFIVNNGSQNFFTRDGSFTVDAAGNLVMANTGYKVMGWQVDPETGDIRQDVVSALTVMDERNLTSNPEATTVGYVTGILDKTDPQINSTAGVIRTMKFYDAQGYEYTAKFSFHGTGDDDYFRVQLDDILDSNSQSLVKKYGLSNIEQIAQFGSTSDKVTTTKYSMDPNAEYDSGTNTFKINMALDTILDGYSANALIVAAGDNYSVASPGAGDLQAGADVTLQATVTLSRAQLEAEPYNLIYNATDSKYYMKDGQGQTSTVVTDWAAALQGMDGLDSVSNVTVDETNAPEIAITFDAAFKTNTAANFNGQKTFSVSYENNGDNQTAILEQVYHIKNGDGKTYTINFVGPDGTAQIDVLESNKGNMIKFDHDTGLFSYIGGEGSNSATLAFNASASTLSGDIIELTQFSNIDIDFSSITNYGNGGKSTLEMTNGTLGNSTIGAGRAPGELIGIEVGQDGKITASYSNGLTKLLGQIAVAEFANAAGLSKAGNNLYSATQNSGEFNGVGVDITASGGSMTSGVLEMSNVDLSSEFTTMITTQRGFQANSRIITTSDTLLEELVNLKR